MSLIFARVAFVLLTGCRSIVPGNTRDRSANVSFSVCVRRAVRRRRRAVVRHGFENANRETQAHRQNDTGQSDRRERRRTDVERNKRGT